MVRSRPFPCLVIGVAAIVGLLVWQSRQDSGEERPAPAPSIPPASVPASRTAQAIPSASSAPPASSAGPSLVEQVDALMVTHDPAQAFLAYRLVQECAQFNLLHDRVIFDQAEPKNWHGDALPGYRGMNEQEKQQANVLCGGMTERQRLARLDYLAIAAKAGVCGAAVAFAEEGPFGDPTALATRPQDPLVREWKATALDQLTRAAESGSDLGALAYLGSVYSGSDLTERNPLLAYRYRMAADIINADMSGPNSPAARSILAHPSRWDGMVQGFTPEQRAAQLAAARDIAARAKERMRHAWGAPAG